eukprot:2189887-Karenia_brevis.AAC.1
MENKMSARDPLSRLRPRKRDKVKTQTAYKEEGEEDMEAEEEKPENLVRFSSMLGVANLSIRTEVARQVQRFFRQLQMRPCKPEQRGTTWLELYTLYKVRGFPCAIGDPESKAEARPVVRQQVTAFRSVVRAIAANTMEQEQERLIKPSEFKGFALKRLGVEMYLPMISGKVVMSRKERSTVDAEILRLKGIKAKEIQEVLS